MKLSRRELMAGAGATALLLSTKTEARILRGTGTIPIGTGWNVLPLGCGGFATGMFIANDGSMVCRTDVGNIYRWSGTTADYADASKTWVPLLNFTSLAGQGSGGGDPVCSNFVGGWEHVLAPNTSTTHLAIFADMAGSATLGWVWYSTNSGSTWGKSNLSFDNDSTGSNYNSKFPSYKIAIDPNNANVAYCGCPYNDGNTAGAYTTLNKAGGSTLSTWTSVKTSGSTPIPDTATSGQLSSGVAIDPTSGTTTIGGQTVTNRIIIPIPGTGIYESTDGGDTFSEVAASAMGASDFWVMGGGFTAEGIYYCLVSHSTIGGVWRYKTGTWTNITPSSYVPAYFIPGGTYLIIDPRNNPTSKAYLSVFGPNGFGIGYTSQNANGASPTWTGATGGQVPTMKATSSDIYYINDIFGQNDGVNFVAANGAIVDPNGICWWPGNQSLFYVGASSSDSTPAGPPIYSNTGSANTVASWSMGRGMEATVAEEALCPPGGTYPVIAVQDLGAPMRGTFTTYPLTMAVPFQEWTCESVEYAASDSSFMVARVTGQNGASSVVDDSRYSTNYGADGTWTEINDFPVYNATMTAGISNGSGGSGFILNVSAISGKIRETAYISSGALGGGSYYGIVQPYGTGGTTGTGGTGTYYLDTSSLVSSTSLYSTQFVQGGQTVAVDHDHWLTVPWGYGGQTYVPNFTTNATGAATWSDTNLPTHKWGLRGWAFGATSKPFAVGYGSDLGTVWALKFPPAASGTATLYRSTDYGATFSSIKTQSVGIAVGVYCLSVPGFPNELWISGWFTGGSNTGLWHVTDANTASPTITSVALPTSPVTEGNVLMLTLGAPSSGGGYPAIYIACNEGGGLTTTRLYKGAVSGGANNPSATVSWSILGSTGKQNDLPATLALAGLKGIRGDWNVHGRIYGASGSCGLAYYNP